MPSSPATLDYQRAHVGLRALTYRDVTKLWSLLDPTRLDATFAVFAAAVLNLIAQRRELSAALARAYLDRLRVGVLGDPPPISTPALEIPAVLVSLRVTSVITIKAAMTNGDPLDLATRNALVRTLGAVDKYIGDGGRELIRASIAADPAATGWVRRTLGTCDFCDLLAGKTNNAGETFPRHDHCGCQPEPVYVPTAVTPRAWISASDGKYTSGNLTVTVDAKLTKAQTQALLDDFDTIVGKLPAEIRDMDIAVHVPAKDPKFSGKRAVGGYVVDGSSTVFMNPKIAKGADLLGGNVMPAAEAASNRAYTLAHEIGHILDHVHADTFTPGGLTPSGFSLPNMHKAAARELWRDVADDLSKYGRSNLSEGYAEAFAQWVIGGPGSNPAADAYAAVYGWT